MRLEKITAKALEKLGGDRYKLSLITSKRADELSKGAKPLVGVDANKFKLIDIAIMEVAEGKVGLDALASKN